MYASRQFMWCLVLLVLLQGGLFGTSTATAQDSAAPSAEGKTLYLLAIGITNYKYNNGKIPRFAAKDAEDFKDSLERTARGTFVRIETHFLPDEQATRVNIGAAAEKIASEARPQDTFVFFFSGHGTHRVFGPQKEELFYLLPSNYNPAKGVGQLYDIGISSALIQSWSLKIAAQHQFMVFDSSKSGAGFKTFVARAEEDNKYLRGTARRDLWVLCVDGISFEFSNISNGLLTRVILQGLDGGAALEGGEVTVKGLVNYVEQQTPVVLKQTANANARRILRRYPNAGIPSQYRAGHDFQLGMKPPESAHAGGSSYNATPTAHYQDTQRRNAWSRRNGSSPRRISSATMEGVRSEDRVEMAASKPPQDDDDLVFIVPPQCAELSELHPSTSTSRAGKDHALLFGVDDYDEWRPPLNHPVFDARSIANVLNTRFGFETEVVKNPSKDCFGAFIQKYAHKRYADDEQLFIFFAGHGKYESNADGFLILKDSTRIDPSYRTQFAHNLLARMINGIPCKHIFLVLDSCFAGAMSTAVESAANSGEGADTANTLEEGSSGNEAADDDQTRQVRALMRYRTRRFLTAVGNDYVSDGGIGNHSPFATKLLSSLESDTGGRNFLILSDLETKVKLAPPIEPVPRFFSWRTHQSESEFIFFLTPHPSS